MITRAKTLVLLAVAGAVCGCGGESESPEPAGEAETRETTPSPSKPIRVRTGTDPDEGLLMRAQVDGRTTSLYEKVVVTSSRATLARRPGELGDVIEPWAVLFRLWTDDGQAEAIVDGERFVRVGTSKGRPLGWIRSRDVTVWSTRFILEPLRPIPGRVFSVDLGNDTRAEYRTAVEDKRRFALITEPPAEEKGDDTRYPVVVYTGLVQAEGRGGAIRRERNKIRDLKLEVVFVVESSDIMTDEYEEGVSALGTVRQIARDWSQQIQANRELDGAVRFGLVEFADATPLYEFPSRVTTPLTGDLDAFLNALNRIDPPENVPDDGKLDDFWAQDALAGLNSAVSDAGWTQNSSKHVILFGASHPQVHAENQGPNPLGRATNEVARFFNRDNDEFVQHGYNTTGMSIQQIIARANPRTGGDVERARNAKTFHSVLIGRDLGQMIDNYDELKPKFEEIVRYNDFELEQHFQRLSAEVGESQAGMFIAIAYITEIYDTMRARAKGRYAEIARNQEVDGLNINVEPTAESIRNAVERIDDTVVTAFKTLGGVRTGRVGVEELENDSNAITQTYFAIVGSAAEKFKDKPAVEGLASVRDEAGREVAQKRVIVSEDELRRLRSTLDAIRTKFQARVRKADRQDVSDVLDELKSLAVRTSAGQAEFGADVELQEAITDLPLRTTALETTPRSLAVMPSDAFEEWLGRLDVAITRADDLLAGKNWLVLSSVAENERFTFLKLSELP